MRAALAFHWGHDENPDFAVEDYYAPVIRYQGFLADHDPLLHPAQPWAQIGLVYPRRAELEEEIGLSGSAQADRSVAGGQASAVRHYPR